MFEKVLFIAPYYKRKGGIASVLTTYKNNIDEFNFFASIYFKSKLINFLLFPFIILHYIIYLLIKPSINIIHIHGSSKGSFYRKYVLFKISKYFNKKVIYHIHGSEYQLFNKNSSNFIKLKIKYFINNSDAIIALSTEWRTYFLDNFNPGKIFILNNIVKFQKAKLKKPQKKIQLLFLGRIGKRKGIFDVLKVISKEKEFYMDKIKLVIGGDGETELLKQIIVNNKLEDIVKFYGWTENDLKDKLLLESHVMILPSFNEGLPITLLEAMSHSMPLISSHVGGISRILKNKKNGIVVVPGDLDMIDNAIKYYIKNKEMVSIHGVESYDIVKDFYPEKVLTDLKDIYSSI